MISDIISYLKKVTQLKMIDFRHELWLFNRGKIC